MPLNVEKYRGFHLSKGDPTGDQLTILVPTTYRVLHFASAADSDTDWNVCNPTHPRFYVHSETTPATDYGFLEHDGDNLRIEALGGGIVLAPVGDVQVPNTFGLIIGHTAQITLNALLPELQVLGTTVGVDAAIAAVLYSATASEGAEIVLGRSKSATLGTNTIVACGDVIGRILAVGADGSTGFDPAAAIQFEVAATPGATTDMPGRIVFLTSPDGSQTPAARMTVLSGATNIAQVRIGTGGTSTGSLLLGGATSGTVELVATAAAGTIILTLPATVGTCGQQLTTNGGTPGVLSWAAASLGAYKNDLGIVCGDEALQMVRATPVHHFTYNRDRVPTGQWAPDYPFVGVFGEEAPHYMQGQHNEIFSPMNSVGYLTAALQALSLKVDALSKRKAA